MNKNDSQRDRQPTSTLRERAEAMLRTSAAHHAEMSTEELHQLIHELQVHQMELEIQNEDLRNAQVQLAQSRDRYSDLYEFAPIGYLTLDAEGVIVEANLTASVMLHVDRKRLPGHKFSDFVRPDSQDGWHLHRRQVFSGETTVGCELEMAVADRPHPTFRVQSQAFHDENGELTLCRIALADVTEQKAAFNALSKLNIDLHESLADRTDELDKSIERLRLLSEAVAHLGEGVLITEDGLDWPGPKIIFVNEAMCRITGYNADELIGQTPRILQGARTDQTLTKHMKFELSRQGSCVVELVNYRQDGTPYDAELLISSLYDRKGRRTNFVSIQRDVTQRKEMERELRREHNLNQSIIQTAQLVVVVLDMEGRIVQFNPYIESLTGWQADEVLGQNWFETFIPPQVRPNVRNVFSKTIDGEVTGGHVNPILTKDGRELEIQWHGDLLRDAEGTPMRLLCCGQDVTERRVLERHIVELSAEEHRRIAIDLHDGIGQELTGLSMTADSLVVALTRAERPEALVAEKLRDGIHRALEQVRILSRGMNPVDVDAQGLMSSLTDLTEQFNGIEGVTCRFECDSPVLLRDNQAATQLYRIAQEAATNALRHGKAKLIVISLRRTKEGVVLSVRDDGIGINGDAVSVPGMGMQTMNYRAGILGGSLQIKPGRDQGTEVTCTIPSIALVKRSIE
ncbi:PAS domain S-box protein [Stieleria sp. ICT_E10.1]|uniref:sensor histidine kinase n=1 Tax=Stieleria sedimenti TaxID=2976331 RepID=UPI002180198A|nr:PAS domain S-box protein [Stieleria sedimenti]MCS7467904.1 PAS domain S-box protein [Stieleria sedimenti]